MQQDNVIALSICIPVYNCAEFISEALDSILGQVVTGVEIVIYDGGSTDATEAVASRYQAAWSCITYHRSPERGGIDADLASCVGVARGTYCWLFSGDDVMQPGAIRRALECMTSGGDVYLCEHTICDKEMRFLREYPVLSPDMEFSADLSTPASRHDWFERAVSTEAFFSFLSGIMVRRDKWLSGVLMEEFVGSCWAHVARLFGLVTSGLRVQYVAETWLHQRGDNDSFRADGLVGRYGLAIDGYTRLAKTFFPANGIECFHVRRVLQFEFGLRLFLDARRACAQNPSSESLAELDRLFAKVHADDTFKYWVKLSIYRFTPAWLLRFAGVLLPRLKRMLK